MKEPELSGGSIQQFIVPLLLVVGVYYLLFVRQPAQQRKAQQQIVDSLNPGTRIVTIGGIFATVVEVREDRVLVEVADGSQLEILTRAVASIVKGEEPELDDESEPEMAEAASEPESVATETTGAAGDVATDD
jgi:preprotein translocase subunit YajC